MRALGIFRGVLLSGILLSLVAAVMVTLVGVARAQEAAVTGTALYRERIALSPDAVFEATLEDVSRVDAKAEIIGRTRLDDPGQPPFAFTIRYDAARIDPRHRYSIRARITHADRLLFITDQAYPVITGGAASTVSLVLRIVSSTVPAASVLGEWRVTSFAAPGISALTPRAASAWIGTRANYAQGLALFGEERCDRPSYETRSMTLDQFAGEYRVRPADVGLRGQLVTRVTVGCSTAWSHRGQVLFVRSPDALLTTWDGDVLRVRAQQALGAGRAAMKPAWSPRPHLPRGLHDSDKHTCSDPLQGSTQRTLRHDAIEATRSYRPPISVGAEYEPRGTRSRRSSARGRRPW